MWRCVSSPLCRAAFASTVPAIIGVPRLDANRKDNLARCDVRSHHVPQSQRMSWKEARQAGYVDDIPDELVNALKRGRCVAQVGAGMSMSAGLPGFETLLRDVAKAGSVAIELPQSGSYGALDHIQSCLTDRLGRETMCHLMAKQLRVPQPLPEKAEALSRAFCKLPFAAVLSWNWDEMLDDEFALVSHDAHGFQLVLDILSNQQRGQDTSQNIRGPLVKMQGSLRDPSRVILDEFDYERRLAPMSKFLQQLNDSRVSFLYVGLSLRWEKGHFGVPPPDSVHFAVVNDVSPEHRRELLQNRGIRVISYCSRGTNFEGTRIVLEEIARRLEGP